MKKTLLSLACVASVFSLSAQRASDVDYSNTIKDYNRIGISYNNTHYGYNDAYGKDHKDNNFGLNGVGIDYIHGFSVSDNLPLFVETGLNLDFNFGTKKGEKETYQGLWMQDKTKWTDINMQIPVNVAWKFAVADNMSIAPYLGLNFKVHFATTYKGELEGGGSDAVNDYVKEYNDEAESINVFSDSTSDMGDKDYTWNRFQMGWHVGVGFQYNPIYLGVQYGTDFIGAYSHKFEYNGKSETAKINTGNLKVTVAYCF